MAADISENVTTTLTVQYADKIDLIIDSAVETLSRSIAEYTARGWTDELIAETITTNLTNPNNPIFGPVLTQLKTQFQSVTAKQRALNQALVWPDTTIYRWICISDKASCPHCLARHGQEGTLEQFMEWGMPGDEWLGGGPACGTNCRCYLIKVSEADKSVDNPVIMDGGEELTRDELLAKVMSRASVDITQLEQFVKAQGLSPLPEI